MSLTATKAVEDDAYERSDDSYASVRSFAGTQEAHEMSEAELERQIEERMRELKRQLLQDHLDSRQGGRALEVVRDGEGTEREQERQHERALLTTFGEVEIQRFGYGGEGLESLHPLDGDLNVPPERYSLEVRRRVAREVARGSFEEAVEAIEETTGISVAKRQAEELAARAAVDFDEFYAAKQALETLDPTPEPILAMSVDGKGIVMRKEDLRAATRKASETKKHKLTTRLSKGEKRNAKRMAAVATVYEVQRNVRSPKDVFPAPGPRPAQPKSKPRPVNKRVWASLELEVEDVVEEMFREASSRDPDHRREWVVVVDGNDHQLRLVRKLAKTHGVQVTTILDVIHVLEYVWSAGLALHAEGTVELEGWVLERMLQILSGRASWVAAGMRRSATKRGIASAKRLPIDKAADYLLKYKHTLRYDEYLAAGYPIASGVIEGACRHLVNVRMNRTGARWSLQGAEAVLRLRALVKSGDFDEYWKFHEARELERNHLSHYADRRLPALDNPARRRSHLRRVK
jgi:hypothetical protein